MFLVMSTSLVSLSSHASGRVTSGCPCGVCLGGFEGDGCVTVPEFSPYVHGLRDVVSVGFITPPEPAGCACMVATLLLLMMPHWDSLFAIFGSERGEIDGVAMEPSDCECW